jgi:regulatory protein
MPIIKNMHLRRGRPERFIVTLDDDQELIFTPEIVLKYRFSPEIEFSDHQFLQILEEDQLRQAKDQAMRYLTRRSHSRTELIRKMREKGYRLKIINQALDELQTVDLVNDENFARQFIQNEIQLRPVSRRLLIQKLLQRGISKELYDPLLEELFSESLEQEMLQTLTQKFLRTHTKDTGQKMREKLLRFLQGKGFSWEQIRQVVDNEQ